MKRRSFIKSSGALVAAASASSLVNAQSTFSYDPPITTNAALPLPSTGKVKVAFAINPGVQVIDLAGPWEVFQDVFFDQQDDRRTPGPAFELYTVSEAVEPIRATGGLKIVPNFSVNDAPTPHLIVIPHFSTEGVTPIHEWIRQVSTETNLIMSICTGAFQLAKTGLVDGKQVTTNQDAYDLFAERYPNVKLERGPRFVEVEGIASSGGLTAGIDLALRTVDRLFGKGVAQKTADLLEYTSTGWRV